jgi:hypothetical protein
MFFAVCPSCNTLNPDPAGIRPQSPFQEFILANMNFQAPGKVPEIEKPESPAIPSEALANGPDWMGAVVKPSAPFNSPDVVPERAPEPVPEVAPEPVPEVVPEPVPEVVTKAKQEPQSQSWFQIIGMGD